MANKTYHAERTFLVYSKEIVQFIEYCKRFKVSDGLDIKYIPESVVKVDDDPDNDKRTGDVFLCHVYLDSDLDVLRFINIFSLFFHLSKSVP
jgi:hypothetical protein